MKTKIILLAFTILTFVSNNTFSQSISITSISKTQFCVGDEFTVDFTATGTFEDDNVFVVQLSYPNGDFSRFQNIGNLKTINSSTINCKIPDEFDSNKAYKIRIMSSEPYKVSDAYKDNLSIFRYGYPDFEISSLYSLPNLEIEITNRADYTVRCYWEFGDDAVPSNYEGLNPPPVKFLTSGKKWMRLYADGEGKCTKSQTKYLTILECQIKIDSNAKVIDTIVHEDDSYYKTYWICSNGTYECKRFNGKYIYMEAGSTVNLQGFVYNCKFYMKPGSSLNIPYGMGSVVIIYTDGASINVQEGWSQNILKCDDLEFDYSEAPIAGKIAQNLAIDDNSSHNNLNIYPNPSDGMLNISLNSKVPSFSISIFDVLGNKIFHENVFNSNGTWNNKIDLSGYSKGMYFIKLTGLEQSIVKSVILR